MRFMLSSVKNYFKCMFFCIIYVCCRSMGRKFQKKLRLRFTVCLLARQDADEIFIFCWFSFFEDLFSLL